MNSADSFIAQGFLAGDGDALREIDSWVFSVIRSRTWFPGQREVEDDLLQEVRSRLVIPIREKQITDSLKGYVCTITMHVCIDCRRKQREFPQLQEIIELILNSKGIASPSPLDRVLIAETMEKLDQAISAMSPEDQDLIRMIYYDGILQKAIAEMLGVAEGTVKSRKYRCIEKLREIYFRVLEGGNPGANWSSI